MGLLVRRNKSTLINQARTKVLAFGVDMDTTNTLIALFENLYSYIKNQQGKQTKIGFQV